MKKVLLSAAGVLLLSGQATAKIAATDYVFPHELLYIMIGFIMLLFALIVWDSRAPRRESGHSLNLEYLLRFIMGASSVLLSYTLSRALTSGSIIYTTASDVWSVVSEWLSVFFLIWGIFMAVYTVGMVLKYFNERSTEATRRIEHGRPAGRR